MLIVASEIFILAFLLAWDFEVIAAHNATHVYNGTQGRINHKRLLGDSNNFFPIFIYFSIEY